MSALQEHASVFSRAAALDLKLICDTCGNKAAIRMRFTERGGCCDHCGRLSSVESPDVYFNRPYLDPNLIDVYKPEQRNGVWIESRRQKAEIMKRLGVREAGDKRGGMRLEDKFSIRREAERRK